MSCNKSVGKGNGHYRTEHGTKGECNSRISGYNVANILSMELTMFELLKSLVFAIFMVPVVMAIILGLIYGLGEVFNIFSAVGHKDKRQQQQH